SIAAGIAKNWSSTRWSHRKRRPPSRRSPAPTAESSTTWTTPSVPTAESGYTDDYTIEIKENEHDLLRRTEGPWPHCPGHQRGGDLQDDQRGQGRLLHRL